MFFIQQGCHWTFAKLTENLRVRAVSQKMNKKREVQKEKDEIGECRWRWSRQQNNPPMPWVVNFYFRQTEQLGEKNGKWIGGEWIGPKITEKKRKISIPDTMINTVSKSWYSMQCQAEKCVTLTSMFKTPSACLGWWDLINNKFVSTNKLTAYFLIFWHADM